jgi:hypothetical protein
MSLHARLIGAALCVATFAAPLPVLADAAPLDLATAGACALDRVREIVAGATQHSEDETERNTLIVENTADWVPAFNAFATAPETADLRAATDSAVATGKLSKAACKQLLPFAAVAASAEAVSKAGATLEPGSVLIPCADGVGLCQPASTATVLDQCNFEPFTLPLRASC